MIPAALFLALLAVLAPGIALGSLEARIADLQLTPVRGETPPPLVARTLDGTTLSLAEHRGQPVLLYFWATW